MPRQKHKPQRSCIACRETKDKRQLIRVVRTPDGEVMIDPTGKAKGRGAYLCRNSTCWDKGLEHGRIARALKVNPSVEELAKLKFQLQTEFAEV
jgi:predicted RNA-binding protein YlxR (DUF448 family)